MNVVHFREIPSWLRRRLSGARGAGSGSSAKCISESLEILEMIPIPLIFRNFLKCGRVQHRRCDFGKILAVPALPGTGVTV